MARFLWLILVAGCGGSGDASCHADGECPVHQLCDRGACKTGCIGDGECGEGLACNGHGRCVAAVFDASTPNDFAIASNSPDLLVPDESDLLMAAEGDLAAAPGCGDGHLDSGEDCDDGANNSDDPATAASCTTHCRRRANCGALTGAEASRIDPDSGHCYVAWPSPAPWAVAESQCAARGGALALAGSPAEEALIKSLAAPAPHWVGLRSSNSDGDCPWAKNGSFEDAPCGWAATGLLPASPASNAGWICESGCGNGVVESGEECDPPDLAGTACTVTCKTIRSCPQGMTSPVSGHCYFMTASPTDYTAALTACPAGTHLASLETLDETALAKQVLGNSEVWIGLRAQTKVGQFAWETGEPFVPARYHGFVADEPNHNSNPTCTRVTSSGWRDQVCNSGYVALCERE